MKSRVILDNKNNKLIFGDLKIDIKIICDEIYDLSGNKIIINKLHNFYILYEDYAELYLENKGEIFKVLFDKYLIENALDYKYTLVISPCNRLEHAVISTTSKKRIERILYPYEVIRNLDYNYGNEIDLRDMYNANNRI